MSTLAPRHVDTCGWRPGSSAGRRRVKPRRGRPLKPAVMPSIRTENARPSGLMAMGLSENTRQPLGRSSGSLRAAVKAELQSRLWSCSRSENQMKSPSTTGTSIGVSSVAADHVTVRLSCRLARNVYGGSALDCGGAVKEEEEEEEVAPEGDEDEDPEAGERKKLDKLRKILNAHDYNSEDEETPPYSRSNTPGSPASKSRRSKVRKAKQAHDFSKAHGPSAKFHQLLEDFAEVVRHQENLLEVSCVGDEVPDEIAHDIAHSVQEHQQERQRKLAARQERGARTAFDALKDQMEELRAHSDGGASGIATALSLPGEGLAEGGGSRMGIRAYVGRRLFSGLGEALFECQRFKSKENEAVSTWQGECAFLAMYLRKMAKEEAEREQTKPAHP
mmetsp:Transcript_62274/g.163168  ORF Transcript_62274/g.163168 Transcript_62274/m.163168 type:complete len:390 (-) Transcript_62274:69-1238(-)